MQAQESVFLRNSLISFENYWSSLVVLIKMTERVVGHREHDREKEGE